jgi:predicted kinase
VSTAPPTATRQRSFVTRIRLRARRRALWLRHLWAAGQADSDRWLAISHGEVDRILVGGAELREAEMAFQASDPACLELETELEAADRDAFADERWRGLIDGLGLTLAEADLLSLAVAAAVEPHLLRVYGYLLDEAAPAHPTPWLAAGLFGRDDHDVDGRRALQRWALAAPAEPAAAPDSPTTGWVADAELAAWLHGRESAFDPASGVALVDGASTGECLYPAELDAMVGFASAVGGSTRAPFPEGPLLPVELELVGPAGAGKRTLAAQFAAALGCDMLAVDVSRLGLDAVAGALRAARRARLSGAIPYWHRLEAVDDAVEETLHGLAPLSVFGVETPRAGRQLATAARRSLTLPVLSREDRGTLWRRLTGAPAPATVTDWALTPGELASVSLVAAAGDHAVVEASRRLLYLGPGELFAPLPCPYSWDDIVLLPKLREHLAEFEAQARLRRPVYEDWGFGRLVPLGAGVTALFAGPSGTGKTMAAQVIARSLGMDLYRVDLAGVMNKYIGETEKRLKQVFDSCERANVLLLFDEADALFGQRTQVRDAHDRFANIEIDYLLQRMEQFSGIAILATNRKNDLDQAFIRRLRFIVDFIPPGLEERRVLWRLSLPERSPSGEPLLGNVDFDALAKMLELSGAAIKAVALGAAFLARAQGARVEMTHILHAARRELAKQAVELPLEWEEDCGCAR